MKFWPGLHGPRVRVTIKHNGRAHDTYKFKADRKYEFKIVELIVTIGTLFSRGLAVMFEVKSIWPRTEVHRAACGVVTHQRGQLPGKIVVAVRQRAVCQACDAG